MSERWRSGFALVLSLVLLGIVVQFGPGDEVAALRRAIGLGKDRLADPADVEPGGVYAYLQTQPRDDTDPVGWDPCREIRYEVNTDGAPGSNERALAIVREAVDEVARITGLRFTYEGATDRRPQWRARFVPVGRNEPVLVSWADAREVRELAGNVAGVGGAVAVDDGAGGRVRYVTGGLTLDVDAWDDLRRTPNGEDQQRALVLHELGHVVGLGHVDSREELMYPDTTDRTTFGTGDLNGLVRLGSLPCR